MPVPKDIDAIGTLLAAGEEVNITGIGKLKVTRTKARTARNPQTGATVNVPAKNVVKFTMSSKLKAALNPA